MLRQINNRFLLILTVLLIFIVVGWQIIRPQVTINPQHVVQATAIALTQQSAPTEVLPTIVRINPTVDEMARPNNGQPTSVGITLPTWTPIPPTRSPVSVPEQEPIEAVEVLWTVPQQQRIGDAHIAYVADDGNLWLMPLDAPDSRIPLTDFAVAEQSMIVTESNIYFRDALYNRAGREHFIYDFQTGQVQEITDRICSEMTSWGEAIDCGQTTISPTGLTLATYHDIGTHWDTSLRHGEGVLEADIKINYLNSGGSLSVLEMTTWVADPVLRFGTPLWSPDGMQLVVIYDAEFNQEQFALLDLSSNRLLDTDFLRVTNRNASPIIADDGQSYTYANQYVPNQATTIQVWSTQDHDIIFEMAINQTATHRLEWYRPLDWHPNARDLLVVEAWRNLETDSTQYSLVLYDTTSTELTRIITLEDQTVTSAQFNGDGTLLLIERNDDILLYDVVADTMTVLPITGDHPQWAVLPTYWESP